MVTSSMDFGPLLGMFTTTTTVEVKACASTDSFSIVSVEPKSPATIAVEDMVTVVVQYRLATTGPVWFALSGVISSNVSAWLGCYEQVKGNVLTGTVSLAAPLISMAATGTINELEVQLRTSGNSASIATTQTPVNYTWRDTEGGAARRECRSHMRELDGAYNVFLSEKGEAPESVGQLVTEGYLRVELRCPLAAGISYLLVTNANERVVCPVVATHPDHKL